jgi:phage shock protein C
MNNRLYRSLDDRVLAGVAGGMAEAYDLDPALVRLVWALLIVFTGGAFLIIYVVMALVVPVRPYGWAPGANPNPQMATDPATAVPGDPSTAAPGDPATTPTNPATPEGAPPMSGPPTWGAPYPHRRRESTGPLVIGALLVLVGAYLLLRQFFPLFELGRFWPVVVILFGIVLIVTAFGRRPSDR